MYYLPHHYTHTLAASSTRPTARPQDPMSDKRSALAQLPLPHSVVTEPGVPHNKRAQSRVNSGSRSTSPAQPHQFPRFAQPDDPPSRTSPPPLSNRSPLPSWQTRKPHRATDARLIGRTQRTCEGGEGRQRFFSPPLLHPSSPTSSQRDRPSPVSSESDTVDTTIATLVSLAGEAPVEHSWIQRFKLP